MQIGDIFYHSWGYDQTNIDFIIVVGFTKSGKSAICRRCKEITDNSKNTFTEFALKPTGEAYGDEFKMKVGKSTYLNNCDTLRGSYPYLNDGKIISKAGQKIVMLATFYPASKDKVYHETKPQFGH